MRWQTVFLLAVSFLICLYTACAFQEGICATAEVTSIVPSSVDADEDFTVGIQVDNCGEDIPTNMTFEITRFSDDILIKEPLKQEIGEMGFSNSKRFMAFHMHSSPDAIPGIHVFETRLTYGTSEVIVQKDSNFSITVTSKVPDLAVSGISTEPETLSKGDIVILTIDIENAGGGEAKDVRVSLSNLDFAGAKSVYLGKIEPDENIPARFILQAGDEGLYSSDIQIQYGLFGEVKTLSFPFQINVFPEKGSRYSLLILAIAVLGIFYWAVRKDSSSSK